MASQSQLSRALVAAVEAQGAADVVQSRLIPIKHNLLCTQVATDGMKCALGWPHCVSYRKCVDQGCFWRKWHMTPPPPGSQYMPTSPPTNTDLI